MSVISKIQVAWALGTGIKETSFKSYWDVELGVTYIPWSEMPDNLDPLASGGFVDEESLPEDVRCKRN